MTIAARATTWLLFLPMMTPVLAAQTPKSPLEGTAWRLVRLQGTDDKVVVPDDGSKYTLQFDTDGRLAARIDCNRGRGTWKANGAQLELGPLATTRAMCPPGSMHDRLAKDLGYVRSYVIKEGHLFLSLMADGGIYEFEPIAPARGQSVVSGPRSPVASTGPVTFECTGGTGGSLTVTFYKTAPGLALLERGGVTKPAFSVRAASGAKYEGQDVSFWEAKGEATVTWSGEELQCRKR